MRIIRVLSFLVVGTLLGCSSLRSSPPTLAEVKAASLFSDHMVLQQGVSAPIWGWSQPGTQVTVSIAGQNQIAVAGPDKKWMVRLNPLKASSQPLEMTIAGSNTITIKDILVGEVWLGSGQSNMEFSVSKAAKRFAGVNNEAEEIAAANYPTIRMFTVPMKTSLSVYGDCEGKWEVCSPQTVGAFSAVGYFFSRQLQKSINQPVGFINTSFGASCAQAWISKDVLSADPKFKPVLDALTTALANAQRNAAPATQPGATPNPLRGVSGPQHYPYLLWNAMLHPVEPYAIRGVLWYQGESITTGGTEMYTQLMNALIQSWRQEFGQPNLPFYFVQLAALDNNSNRPEVREAQARSLALPYTGMAVTIDIGDKGNVHPKNKQELGDRLAKIARANVYGEKIEYSGPMYDSMKVEGDSIRVKFTHAAGLTAKGGDLKWVQIAGDDRKFVNAIAKIDGDSIVVGSPDVSSPKAVRYAWNRWPEGCNLYNSNGLPAAPFRTDNW